MDGEPRPSTEKLLAQLRDRVEARRGRGEYPPGLEEDLEAHFQRIVSRGRAQDLELVRSSLHALEGRMAFNRARIPASSELPGGAVLHRSVGKLVGRQTEGVLDQVRLFAEAVRETFEALLDALEMPGTHVHADLIEQVDGALERLAAFERTPGDPRVAVAELERRVEHLEAREASRHFEPWYGNDRFESEFRGSREELLDRYRSLAAELVGCAPVLDVGCGRGEFLELLAEVDVDARGIDSDPRIVEAAKARGLKVDHADGIEWLAGEVDRSLGGLVTIQVVEHLSAQQVADLVRLAADKLRPGGKAVVETVNPQSLYVFAHSFYLDPTHVHPVHPGYLAFLFREAGFSGVRIEWRSEPGAEEMLQRIHDDGVMDENIERINRVLFGPQDYALIAVR
jgi:2-polyprenyl-3-methyl-5-hydroxy-6-metoxy-1,4-benzoquinol methylase